MKKLESTFTNMMVVLVGITAFAAAGLGAVYEVTKAPIENARMAKQQAAIGNVTPKFNNDPMKDAVDIESEGGIVKVFPAKDNDKVIGAAVETFSNNGFSGLVKIMVGFDAEGNIIDYAILEHKETPGLGSKMAFWFRDGGKGNLQGISAKESLTVKKDGGTVDAITAATISSRAFLDAVNRGYSAYKSYLENNN